MGEANQVLQNKLTNLERSSELIDWNEEEDNLLVRGSATQPPLSRILRDGLEFLLYFSKTHHNINNSFKTINVRSEKCMDNFGKSFQIDLNNERILGLITLTQYVNNANSIN